MLELTDQAKDAIKGMIEENEVGPNGGLRIVASGGTNGDTEIELDLAEQAEPGDQTVSADGVNVFLDAAAAAALDGMRLDVHAHGDHFHFSLEEQS
jgi:Fe-S cluster assembly iron-binding protein IscA